MADPLQKIKSSFNKGITTITVKTSSTIEKTKLSTHIYKLKEDILSLYTRYGQDSYKKYKNVGNVTDESLKEIFKNIEEKENTIRSLLNEIKKIDEQNNEILGNSQNTMNQSKFYCSNCGASYSTKVNFCRKCGKKIE